MTMLACLTLTECLSKEPQAVSSSSDVEASLTHSTSRLQLYQFQPSPCYIFRNFLNISFIFPFFIFHLFLFLIWILFFFLCKIYFFSIFPFSFQKLPSFTSQSLLPLYLLFRYLIKFQTHNMHSLYSLVQT